MEHAEIVKTDGQDRIRFMKEIPTAGVGLVCHGESIADDAVAAIDKSYPTDLARGYKLGDVRGAFSLSKPLVNGTAANAVTSRRADAKQHRAISGVLVSQLEYHRFRSGGEAGSEARSAV